MYVIRRPRTGQPAMPIVCIVPNGKASFDRSVLVTACRIVRAFGPIRVSTDHAEVTSNN